MLTNSVVLYETVRLSSSYNIDFDPVEGKIEKPKTQTIAELSHNSDDIDRLTLQWVA